VAHAKGEKKEEDSENTESYESKTVKNPRAEEPPEVEEDNDVEQDTKEVETTGPSNKRMRPVIITMHTHTHISLSLPHILYSIIFVEDMLGFVPKMRYTDHGVTEVAKFLDLAHDVYMENKGRGPLGDLIFDLK
jgi:hypothetical protein